MMRAPHLFAFASAFVLAFAACNDSSAVKETPPPRNDGGTVTPFVDGGSDLDGSAPSDCFTTPQTYEEIINACTDAVKVDKKPNLPLLLPDGGLPPVP